MQPKEYKPIIVKTLKEQLEAGRKFQSIDALSALIVEKMDVYREMIELEHGQIIGVESKHEHHVVIQQPAHPTVDISQRINSPSQELSEEQIIALKTEVNQAYRAKLPPSITLGEPDFKVPLILKMDSIDSAPGQMPQVKVAYSPVKGAGTLQVVSVVTGIVLTPEEVEKEIRRLAVITYSGERRSVQPVRPAPVSDSFEDRMKGAVHADTDRETSVEDMSAWSKAVATPHVQWKSSVDISD